MPQIDLLGVSAVIIARDEERFIEGCLRSLKFCQDIIVVVDDRSEDATEEIAKKYAGKVLRRHFDNFAAQKNFGIAAASCDWILILDADERITPELKSEIKAAIQSDYWGYDIPTKPYVFGEEIRHSGWAPSYHLRLFRAGGSYEGAVHETIPPQGKIGRLAAPIIHYNYIDVAHFLAKMNQYTGLEAVKLQARGVKFRPYMIFTEPAREVAYRLIKQQGFRDGFMGWTLAFLMGSYRLVSTLKFWELSRRADPALIYKELDQDLMSKLEGEDA